MNKRDYYEVLDLVPNCTIKDVKKNYHKLALVWHPVLSDLEIPCF